MNIQELMLNIINFIQTMMNFMIISRKVAIQGPVTLYAGPMGMLWGTTCSQLESNKVVQKINYLYNNNVYTYVSRSMTPIWPPPAPPREMGFHPAIKSAEAVIVKEHRSDVTLDIKRLAGPRGDWHQRRFSPKDVFGEECSMVILTDVIGGTREVSADDHFYVSSGSTSEAR